MSAPLTLDKNNLKSIGKALISVVLGSVLAYFASLLPGLDLGKHTAEVMPVLTMLVHIAQEYFPAQ